MVVVNNTSKTRPIILVWSDISDRSDKLPTKSHPVVEPLSTLNYLLSSTGTMQLSVFTESLNHNDSQSLNDSFQLLWRGFVPISDNNINIDPEKKCIFTDGQCFPNMIETFDSLPILSKKNSDSDCNWWTWTVLFLILVCILVFILTR